MQINTGLIRIITKGRKLFILWFYCICSCFAAPPDPPVNGFYKELYQNGKTKEQGYFSKGVKDKLWIYYNERGTATRKEKWKGGELLWTMIYEKGRVIRTIDKDGKVTEKSKCGC